ncbi:MAG: PP0621 family protein [Burkholderiales bacterium]|nr:PP0621 family protein [Burkholderiales bacterium]
MGRLLLILLVVVLLAWLLRRALAGRARGAPHADAGVPLVRCAHCGLNLPKTEARSAGGRHYCSEEHWRLGPRDG